MVPNFNLFTSPFTIVKRDFTGLMSIIVVYVAVVFLLCLGVTAAVECDRNRLWQNPIACAHSLPCLFMSPIIEEVFPKSFSIRKICKLH